MAIHQLLGYHPGMEQHSAHQGELLKGNTPTLILAVLADGALHGYGIAREIERRSGAVLSLGEGSLYPALRSLERSGFVEGRWEPQAAGPPEDCDGLPPGAGLLPLAQVPDTPTASGSRSWPTARARTRSRR